MGYKKKKFNQVEVKQAIFDIDYNRFGKPNRVRFSFKDEFEEFVGKTCIQDFINEIMQKKYRGYEIFPMDGRKSDCIDKLSLFLKKHNYDVDLGMNNDKCIYLKLYQHRYLNDKGKTTHSNLITFIKPM